MSKDLRIEFKFKNAALLTRLREKFGEDVSFKHMAEVIEVGYSSLIYLLSLCHSPFATVKSRNVTEINGIRYSKSAMKIANFLDYADPAKLFPFSLYSLRLPKKYHRDFESIQLLSFHEAREQKLLPPVEFCEEDYDSLGLKERMNGLLGKLTEREEKVIRMRFGFDGDGEKTMEEVAKEFGVSRTRVQQIEKKAIRRLKAPARKKLIEDFYVEGGRQA